MTATVQDDAATPRKIDSRMLVICQILGLAALSLIIYSVASHNYRLLKYTAFIIPAILAIPKPNFIPYLFILNFFVPVTIFTASGLMLRVMMMDVIFLFFAIIFVSNQKSNYKEAILRQRPLFIILCMFMLWAIVGYVVNFYGRTLLVNATSAFFVFNIAQLVVAIVIFSHSAWKEHRNKIIVFYIVCALFEIGIALALEVMSGARTIKGFYKLTGTLGGHHGMLAIVLILSTGVASATFFRLRDKFLRYVSLCASVLCVVLLFISGSRSSIMGMVLAVPAIVFLNYSHKKKAWLILILSMFVAFAALWMTPIRGILFGMIDFNNMDNPDMSAYGRVLIWKRVYEHAMYGPWLQKIVGIGVGAFNTLRFNYYLEVGTFTTGAHNNYLHAFVETGIVGLMIYLAIFIEIIRRLVARGRRGDNSAKCFLMCTLALMFSSLTQETFWFNPAFGRIWLQYMFCYLLLFSFYDKDSDNTKNESGLSTAR